MVDVHKKQNHHFVLVHGLAHGAWCWYKLIPRLEAAGHRVTAIDLAGAGINPKKIGRDVLTLNEYTEPLLEILASLPPNEKVVLVGHSFGGLSISLAAEKFPHKISVLVFLTAYTPDTVHKPSYVLDKLSEFASPDYYLDTKFTPSGTPEHPITLTIFGHKFLALKFYQLSPTEDLELAKTLVRPGSLFLEELSKANNFSSEGYGSVARVYVVCDEDLAIPVEFQRWMIDNYLPEHVLEIKGVDHMAMISQPHQVSDVFLEIAHKYA